MSSVDDSYRKSFGARLAAARKRADMTQAVFADWVGIGRATLSRYERGDLTPPTDVLAEIAKVLKLHDVSLEWLLYGPSDEDEDEPLPRIRLKRFGTLVGLRFTRGGEAEVLMTGPEVYSFLEACGTLEASRTSPSQDALDAIDFLVDHFSECEERFSLLADVPIAVHGARLVPSVPDWETREDLAHWTVFGGMEPDLPERRDPDDPANDSQAGNKVQQKISGEGHQIAGGNIENRGSVSIGRRYKK